MPVTPESAPETILVVDDDADLLKLVVTILEQNFHVISASSGPTAIKLAAARNGKIDLVLSDVDMPEISGPDLGEALKKSRPDLRVMLMSGGRNGNLLVLNYGWSYIQKPFVPVKLVQMIKDILHSRNRSQPGGQEFDIREDRPGEPWDSNNTLDHGVEAHRSTRGSGRPHIATRVAPATRFHLP